MRKSIFALLAAWMFLIAGTSELRAQDATANADADAAADATADADAAATVEAPSDLQVVEASFLKPGAFEPMALNVEFSGSGDDLAAAITIPGTEMRFELTDLLLVDDEFSFSLVTDGGNAMECWLYQVDDDSFRGECMAEDGEGAEITIGAFEK